MLLSKDRQNLLKIYSFDFLFVGIQVSTSQGMLDEHIWEFEWKRLDRHSKKAVSPIILVGYFRDVLKLGHGDISLNRIVEESKLQVSMQVRHLLLKGSFPEICLPQCVCIVFLWEN